MWSYWWSIFSEGVFESLKIIGRTPSEILFSALVFVVVGALLLVRRGTQKVVEAAKASVKRALREESLIVLVLLVVLTIYHMGNISYLRWKAAFDSAGVIKQQLDQCRAEAASNEPDFKPRVEGAMVATAGDKTNAVVGVVSLITNQGVAGSISDFWLDVKFNDGRVLHVEVAEPSNPRTNFIFGKSTQGLTMSLPGTQYWPNENLEPVPQYGERRGFLMGIVRGVTKEELLREKATIVFTCSDTTGKKSSSEYTLGTGKPSDEHIGLEGLQKPIPARH